VRIASMTASWVRMGIGGGIPSVWSERRPDVLTVGASISYRAPGAGALERTLLRVVRGFRGSP
jgi:hypothetical protein